MNSVKKTQFIQSLSERMNAPKKQAGEFLDIFVTGQDGNIAHRHGVDVAAFAAIAARRAALILAFLVKPAHDAIAAMPGHQTQSQFIDKHYFYNSIPVYITIFRSLESYVWVYN